MTRAALALFALALFALPALAVDVIELKGGGTIRGEILEETERIVVIKPTFGGRIELDRARILSISKVESIGPKDLDAPKEGEDEAAAAAAVAEKAGFLLYDRARMLRGYQVARRLQRDGLVVFETETVFFGSESEPRLWLRIHETCGPDLEPRSFVYRERVGDGSELLRTGEIEEGRLRLVEVRRGEKQTRSMLVPTGLRFASAARRELFRRPDGIPDEGTEVTVFDPISGEAVAERWTRAGVESLEWDGRAVDVAVLLVTRRGATSEWRVAESGLVLAAELNGPDVTIVRVPFDRVEKLMTDGDLEDAAAGRLVNTHADLRHGFRIRKPGSDWEFQAGRGDRLIELAEPRQLFAYVAVLRDGRIPEGTELATFAGNVERLLADRSEGFVKESETFGTLAGEKAIRLVARHRNKGEDLRSLVVIAKRGDIGWVIAASCPVKYFDRAKPVFEGIVATFAWLE